MELMNHHWMSGRSPIAPQVQYVGNGNEIDHNGLKPFLFQLLGIKCYHI